MKRYIPALLIIFFMFIPGNVFSQQKASKTDSLTRRLEILNKNDTTRLQILRELARNEQSTEHGVEWAKELIKEAEQFNNIEQCVFGYYYILIYYYNYQDLDKVNYYADIIIPLAEKGKVWLVYFDVLKIRIYCNYIKGDYELGIHNAQFMLKKAERINSKESRQGEIQAYICLGMAYVGTERYDEGIEALTKAYHKIEDKKTVNFIDAVTMLISCYYFKGDFDAVYRYVGICKEGIDNIKDHPIYGATVNNYYALMDIYYGYYYLNKNQPEVALLYLLKAEQELKNNGFILYKTLFHDAMGKYYDLKRDYKNALASYDSCLAINKEVVPREYYKRLTDKANVLMKMGNTEQALPLFRDAIYGKDSLTQKVSERQLAQYREIYKLNQHEIKQEKLSNDRNIILAIFIIIISFILLSFIIHSALVRNRLKDAEMQMKEATILASEANDIKERFLSNLSYTIRTPLNSVVGFSQLITDGADINKDLYKEYGMIIQKSSKELMTLVNNVLDLSRLEAGMMKFDLQEYAINQLLNDIDYIIRKEYNDISLSINSEITEDLITTDYKRFIQTIISILTIPSNNGAKNNIILSVTKDNSMLIFTINGTSLAIQDTNTQEIIIQNEINRLFIEYFGGNYVINPDQKAKDIIVFTYPISK